MFISIELHFHIYIATKVHKICHVTLWSYKRNSIL